MDSKKGPKFYAELKQLNEDLLKLLNETNKKSPYFDFTPTLEDYIKQFKALDTEQNSLEPIKPSFNFSFTNNIASTTNSSFIKPSSTTNSFLPQSTTNTTSLFSFSLAPKTENTVGEIEREEVDEPPPEPNVDKYQEPNATYQVRCKLYERGHPAGSASFNLLGFGELFVKKLDAPNKLQVIIRQEPDLRRVMLNEVITQNIPIKLLAKAVQMIVPGPNGETKIYIAKVKEEKDVRELFDLLSSTRP